MMIDEPMILISTAFTIGLFHTLFGPDHYLPFIAIGKARKWTFKKTIFLTVICGIGHVASSILLGLIGVFVGVAVFKLEAIEAMRGDIAAWFLTAFGFTYMIWGIHRLLRNRPHKHLHFHGDGTMHRHSHTHRADHAHMHEGKSNITPWILFTVFILGPCEPLIPILMYPAAQSNLMLMVIVTLVFSVTTIMTMVLMVTIFTLGLNQIRLKSLDLYGHPFAGFVIFLSGVGILFLGL